MLHINDITLRLGPRVLFDHASAALPEGARIGFVGRNGTGKTTLFKMIADELQPDGGSLSIPRQLKMGRVEQEAPGGPGSLIDFVLAADTERARLLEEAETARDPQRIADIHARLVDIDAHSAPARAGAHPLGPRLRFRGADAAAIVLFRWLAHARRARRRAVRRSPTCCCSTSRPTTSTSRVRCGSSTISSRYPATILVISHDRDMLDAVCNHILHLNHSAS